MKKKIEYRHPVFLMGTRFLRLYVIVGLLLRIVLMMITPAGSGLSFGFCLKALLLGIPTDAAMGLLLTIPMVVIGFGLNEVKYDRRIGWGLEILWLLLFIYSLMPFSLFHQYGGGAPKVARLFFGWKVVSFSLRFFLPKLREGWRRWSLYFLWGLYVFLFLVITVGEVFFWQEFGVRYNFIAVDYLVYTNEVIGNIMESYAIVPLLLVALALTIGLILLDSRHERFRLTKIYNLRQFAITLGIYVVLCGLSMGVVTLTHRWDSGNQYATELGQNGAYDFLFAFNHNQLDYKRFYALLPDSRCKRLYRQLAGLDARGEKQLGEDDGNAVLKETLMGRKDTVAKRPNIVVITVESLSGDFFARYGNTEGLTPHLDQLAKEGLCFDHLYANGNRTVRGLEALSLCMPPSAGESIIKRKDNRMGMLSVGAVLHHAGYRTQFLYGGDAYFDNMADFFSHNGYEVIDRKTFSPDEITFSNIWGVCDGDMFRKSLKIFDADSRSGQPFMAQIMTTSNHRPYTYPLGGFKVVGKPQSRENAVRYTDAAIASFLTAARQHSWFRNTVFVIIADHCASSAGKLSLPLENYHIPCIVYAPDLIKPRSVETVCSQIDVMPTVLSLMRIPVTVRFAGQNVFSPSYRPRAFMATYQDLGYLEGNLLTVLSPVRKIRQYQVMEQPDHTFLETPLRTLNRSVVERAQAYYQEANLSH